MEHYARGLVLLVIAAACGVVWLALDGSGVVAEVAILGAMGLALVGVGTLVAGLCQHH